MKAKEIPHYTAEKSDSVPPILPLSTIVDPIKLHSFLMSLNDENTE